MIQNRYVVHDKRYVEDLFTRVCFNNFQDICDELNRMYLEEKDAKQAYRECSFEKTKAIEVIINICNEYNLDYNHYLSLIK